MLHPIYIIGLSFLWVVVPSFPGGWGNLVFHCIGW